jgi:cyclopropane fatty-acyl-phospholipid synthase-like methyltransferase
MNTKPKTATGDPIGQAIHDYATFKKPFDNIVSSDLCDDDIIPIEVLFRKEDEMPELEQRALDQCRGAVLDIGAGAGVHAIALQDRGHQVCAIDLSAGAVAYMKENGIDAKQMDFYALQNKTQYNTVLSLMNGLGLAKNLENLPAFLQKVHDLLLPGGRLIADSTDVKYLYEDEDGGYWIDLNSAYYGNFKFQMHYNKISGPEFEWLYVDYDTLHQHAADCGFKCRRAYTTEEHYLAVLEKI